MCHSTNVLNNPHTSKKFHQCSIPILVLASKVSQIPIPILIFRNITDTDSNNDTTTDINEMTRMIGCVHYKVEGVRPRGRSKRTGEVVETRQLNTEDAVDNIDKKINLLDNSDKEKYKVSGVLLNG